MRNFTEQTHFIGVPLPDALLKSILSFRNYTHERYGCRSGHSTLPHITIVPPFVINSDCDTADIEGRLSKLKVDIFNAEVDGFGSFDERTIFAHVQSSREWTALRDAVILLVHDLGFIRADRRPFRPHITIANRDIPAGATYRILEYLSSFDIRTEFPVDKLVIFERRDHRWIEARRLRLLR